jgi:hypothetical protein
VLTHGHADHCGSAAELHEVTGAPVLAGAGDAAVIRGEAPMPPPVLEEWERPILERVSAGLPDVAPPVPVDRELRGGGVLDFGGGAEVLSVPGHTQGSIALHPASPRCAFNRGHCRQCRCRHARCGQPESRPGDAVVSPSGGTECRCRVLRSRRAAHVGRRPAAARGGTRL